MAKSKAGSDLSSVFDALRAILAKYESKLVMQQMTPTYCCLVGAKPGPNGKPTWFAGVRLGKRHVSYYLMPVYGNKALLDDMPDELKKRMQGKACFNFKSVDPVLFKALEKLTKKGFECFSKLGWI